MKTRAIALLALLWVLSAHAADVAGTWNLTVSLPAGTGTPTLVLVQNGETLSGTYTGRFGTSSITGTSKGDAIEFSFTAAGPMGAATVTYTGTVAGDRMSGNMSMGPGMGGSFSGERKKQ